MRLFIIILLFIFSGCDDDDKTNQPDCSPNNCSGNGTCELNNDGESYCSCDPNYIPGVEEFTCVYEDITDKPIIYLYPQQKTTVRVAFTEPEMVELTHTYPKYPEGGWEVIASPDGTLEDPDTGRKYYSLYWEGYPRDLIEINTGFVVKAEDTVSFLEEKLDFLGLDHFEAAEFIIYWMPVLESNSANLIHFATEEWVQTAKLTVTPQPDTNIRILMLYREVDPSYQIPTQTLTKGPAREGFTLVEWGGRHLSPKEVTH